MSERVSEPARSSFGSRKSSNIMPAGFFRVRSVVCPRCRCDERMLALFCCSVHEIFSGIGSVGQAWLLSNFATAFVCSRPPTLDTFGHAPRDFLENNKYSSGA